MARICVGLTNQYGITCLNQHGRYIDCVCKCGEHFETTTVNFDKSHGCSKCRHENKVNVYHDYLKGKRGRPRIEDDRPDVSILNPDSIWKRICERHRNGETDITDIALKRKEN